MITCGEWTARLNAGLSPKETEATAWCANGLTMKEIARKMGVSPATVSDRLGNARFKLGMQRTVRGLCLEAMKRGIISPLMLALCTVLVTQHTQPATPYRRPPIERRLAQQRAYSRYELIAAHA
ncbi:response regulator transcription factor [Pseudomonas sp. Marseille-QA0892]